MKRVRGFYRPDRGTIFINELRSPDPLDQPSDTAQVLSHEHLHHALDEIGEPEASKALDTMPKYVYGPYEDLPEMSGLYTHPSQLRRGGVVAARRRERI